MKIQDANLSGKTVIIRCDYNVPINDNKISDDTRIKASLKTINYVLESANKVILLSHMGRIKTKEDTKKYSLRLVSERLSELLNKKVAFCTYDDDINKVIDENKIILFENTRFFDLDNKKESNCDLELSKYFASFGDIFINDAFGTCHRKNASNVGISKFLPSYNGFLVMDEINMLNNVKNDPKKPYIVIMGGAKVSDKISLIENIIKKADKLIISGGMAFSFLKIQNINVGKSIVDPDSFDFCREILSKHVDKIVLPLDVYVSKKFENGEKTLRNITDINDDEMALDVGEKTIELYKNIINDANTIFFNGPVGVFEFENFSYGTKELLKMLKEKEDKVYIGGGDSLSAIKKFNISFKNVSTGGGASLEYIEGNKLPGIFEGE